MTRIFDSLAYDRESESGLCECAKRDERNEQRLLILLLVFLMYSGWICADICIRSECRRKIQADNKERTGEARERGRHLTKKIVILSLNKADFSSFSVRVVGQCRRKSQRSRFDRLLARCTYDCLQYATQYARSAHNAILSPDDFPLSLSLSRDFPPYVHFHYREKRGKSLNRQIIIPTQKRTTPSKEQYRYFLAHLWSEKKKGNEWERATKEQIICRWKVNLRKVECASVEW